MPCGSPCAISVQMGERTFSWTRVSAIATVASLLLGVLTLLGIPASEKAPISQTVIHYAAPAPVEPGRSKPARGPSEALASALPKDAEQAPQRAMERTDPSDRPRADDPPAKTPAASVSQPAPSSIQLKHEAR